MCCHFKNHKIKFHHITFGVIKLIFYQDDVLLFSIKGSLPVQIIAPEESTPDWKVCQRQPSQGCWWSARCPSVRPWSICHMWQSQLHLLQLQLQHLFCLSTPLTCVPLCAAPHFHQKQVGPPQANTFEAFTNCDDWLTQGGEWGSCWWGKNRVLQRLWRGQT